MSKAWARRRSPAMVVALVALFAALGGSAYAAKKIGTKEIKANAITAGKIKKNAITTAKIKKEAVTGAKIKESSLGPVPNATNAVNATNASNATNFSRFHASGLVKLSVGETKNLLTIGPFTFTSRCKDLGGGEVEVESFATTTQEGSNIAAEDEYYEGDFNPGVEAEVGYAENGTTPIYANYGYGGYYSGFNAASADGQTLISGEVTNTIKSYGADCAVWMFANQG